MKISPALLYAPCPCGSGKKFKFCHLDAVRGALPDDPSASDVMAAVRRTVQPFGMVNDVDPIEDRAAIEYMKKGMEMRDKGDWEEALDAFHAAREERPKLYTAWNNEAQCLWFVGRMREAILVQREGLSLSADTNAYGWAQLARMHHALFQDLERDRCLEKALAVAPLSADAAAKTCEALADAGRDREVLDYALGCGFPDAPLVAYHAGVAAANCGETALALEKLRTVAGAVPASDHVALIVRDLTAGTHEHVERDGRWSYVGVQLCVLSENSVDYGIKEGEELLSQMGTLIDRGKHVSPGTAEWDAVRDAYKAMSDAHPEMYRATFNYAAMLEREGRSRDAHEIVHAVFDAHPFYTFARAALVNEALSAENLPRAEELIDSFRHPGRMHPLEQRAWHTAECRYFWKVEKEEQARNLADAIRRLEDVFDLPPIALPTDEGEHDDDEDDETLVLRCTSADGREMRRLSLGADVELDALAAAVELAFDLSFDRFSFHDATGRYCSGDVKGAPGRRKGMRLTDEIRRLLKNPGAHLRFVSNAAPGGSIEIECEKCDRGEWPVCLAVESGDPDETPERVTDVLHDFFCDDEESDGEFDDDSGAPFAP